MADRPDERERRQQGNAPQDRSLENPYGLAAPVKKGVRHEARHDGSADLRCPSCGRRISVLAKWWDTIIAWYTDSYRLIRCRRCGTRFAARRKKSTTNKI